MIEQIPYQVYEYKLICDACCAPAPLRSMNKKSLGYDAVKRGWKIRYEEIQRSGGDRRMVEAICPNCIKKRRKNHD